jgi:hypothetical protein
MDINLPQPIPSDAFPPPPPIPPILTEPSHAPLYPPPPPQPPPIVIPPPTNKVWILVVAKDIFLRKEWQMPAATEPAGKAVLIFNAIREKYSILYIQGIRSDTCNLLIGVPLDVHFDNGTAIDLAIHLNKKLGRKDITVVQDLRFENLDYDLSEIKTKIHFFEGK